MRYVTITTTYQNKNQLSIRKTNVTSIASNCAF